MERLITVADVKERYGCSGQTARRYIRQCDPHMEKPLATTPEAFKEWEMARTVYRPRHLGLDDFQAFRRAETVVVPRRR